MLLDGCHRVSQGFEHRVVGDSVADMAEEVSDAPHNCLSYRKIVGVEIGKAHVLKVDFHFYFAVSININFKKVG